jgi:hypothetical protein
MAFLFISEMDHKEEIVIFQQITYIIAVDGCINADVGHVMDNVR